MELGRNAYVKQMMVYLSNQDFEAAYPFGKEFVDKFPEEMVAHFLYAKAAFWKGDFKETAQEGRKAFNLATTPEDILACATIASTGYYELGEYGKGYELLMSVDQKSQELESMRFVFALALKDEAGAIDHAKKLHDIDRKKAEELMLRVLQGA